MADVTIPDGTVMSPGQAFVKKWQVRNSGTCNWEAGDDRLLWSGEVGLSMSVVITYQVTVNVGLPNGEIISNSATVNDGAGYVLDLFAGCDRGRS